MKKFIRKMGEMGKGVEKSGNGLSNGMVLLKALGIIYLT